MKKEDFNFLDELTNDQLWLILYHRRDYEEYCFSRGVLNRSFGYDKSKKRDD